MEKTHKKSRLTRGILVSVMKKNKVILNIAKQKIHIGQNCYIKHFKNIAILYEILQEEARKKIAKIIFRKVKISFVKLVRVYKK